MNSEEFLKRVTPHTRPAAADTVTVSRVCGITGALLREYLLEHDFPVPDDLVDDATYTVDFYCTKDDEQ